MRARIAGHRGRSASVGGATLAVLLVFLAHVLACSGGHPTDETSRADSAITAPVSPHAQAVALTGDTHAATTAPDGHGHVTCSDENTSAAQSARTTVPVPSPLQSVGLAPAALAADFAAPPGRHPETPPVGPFRSSLGVWRT